MAEIGCLKSGHFQHLEVTDTIKGEHIEIGASTTSLINTVIDSDIPTNNRIVIQNSTGEKSWQDNYTGDERIYLATNSAISIIANDREDIESEILSSNLNTIIIDDDNASDEKTVKQLITQTTSYNDGGVHIFSEGPSLYDVDDKLSLISNDDMNLYSNKSINIQTAGIDHINIGTQKFRGPSSHNHSEINIGSLQNNININGEINIGNYEGNRLKLLSEAITTVSMDPNLFVDTGTPISYRGRFLNIQLNIDRGQVNTSLHTLYDNLKISHYYDGYYLRFTQNITGKTSEAKIIRHIYTESSNRLSLELADINNSNPDYGIMNSQNTSNIGITDSIEILYINHINIGYSLPTKVIVNDDGNNSIDNSENDIIIKGSNVNINDYNHGSLHIGGNINIGSNQDNRGRARNTSDTTIAFGSIGGNNVYSVDEVTGSNFYKITLQNIETGTINNLSFNHYYNGYHILLNNETDDPEKGIIHNHDIVEVDSNSDGTLDRSDAVFIVEFSNTHDSNIILQVSHTIVNAVLYYEQDIKIGHKIGGTGNARCDVEISGSKIIIDGDDRSDNILIGQTNNDVIMGSDAAFEIKRPVHTTGAGSNFTIKGQKGSGPGFAGGFVYIIGGDGMGPGLGGSIVIQSGTSDAGYNGRVEVKAGSDTAFLIEYDGNTMNVGNNAEFTLKRPDHTTGGGEDFNITGQKGAPGDNDGGDVVISGGQGGSGQGLSGDKGKVKIEEIEFDYRTINTNNNNILFGGDNSFEITRPNHTLGGDGTDFKIKGQQGGTGGNEGGSVTISGGVGTLSAAGGNVVIESGQSASGGVPGTVTVKAGQTDAFEVNNDATVTFNTATTFSATSMTLGADAAFTLKRPDRITGGGTNFNITGQKGAAAGSAGGNVVISGGDAGSDTTAAGSGVSGDVVITAGATSDAANKGSVKIGGSTDKVGFFGADGNTRPANISLNVANATLEDVRTALGTLLQNLEGLGLIAGQ